MRSASLCSQPAYALMCLGVVTASSNTAWSTLHPMQATTYFLPDCLPSVNTPELIAASILMQDHFFQPVLGQMVKLVFLSSGVHQIIFSIKSTLPFAVGQVQDVGLIFLSAMATSVVEASRKAGKDNDVTLGTVLVTLLLTTFLVGVLIILTGTCAT